VTVASAALIAFGLFLVGGVISFFRQRKHPLATGALAVCAAAALLAGALWR
jgi:hypothetical protein